MFKSVLGAVLLAAASSASAATYIVDALANSSSGGTALSTVSVGAGTTINVSVAATDLWSAGALPRWSNANGLTGPLFATGSDESGEAAGTQIGSNFGTYIQDGFAAPYGALVGKLGSTYYLVGTSFSLVAPTAGTFDLYYWDSNAGDNMQFITADVTTIAVPEPASWALLVAGFGMIGFAARRRRTLQPA